MAMDPPPDGRPAGDAASGNGKITPERMQAAALAIIDCDGADALSMRRLARALDRNPMTLYRHAPDKAALLDGIAETILAQLRVDSADPDWAGQLRAVARRFRALALAHPHVVPLIVTRPLATPLGLRPAGTLRPLEGILALLTRAGFSVPGALHIYRALFGFLQGHVLDEVRELVENPDETDDLVRLGLHRLPITEFPVLRGLPHALAAYDGAAELEHGLDILLTGLTTTLAPPGETRGCAKPVVDEIPALHRSLQRTMASNARLRKGILVAHPVVHFEIIGRDPDKLRNYFGELFGWQFDTSSPVAEAVSEPTDYGFVDRITTPDGTGIPGGIGGGARYQGHAIFYVGVPNVEAALAEAERLGGKRQMGPERAPTGLVVGHFTDPEGNLIGVAGTA